MAGRMHVWQMNSSKNTTKYRPLIQYRVDFVRTIKTDIVYGCGCKRLFANERIKIFIFTFLKP